MQIQQNLVLQLTIAQTKHRHRADKFVSEK